MRTSILGFIFLVLGISSTMFLSGCGGGGGSSSGASGGDLTPPVINPTVTPITPTVTLISAILSPPTTEQQVMQGLNDKICEPAVATTLYRVITGRPFDLEQAKLDLIKTPGGSGFFPDLAVWFPAHGIDASMTTIAIDDAYDLMLGALHAGNYVVPSVYENADTASPHTFIVYGIDNGKVLISDSLYHENRSNRISIDWAVFKTSWLMSATRPDGRPPITSLIFVNSRLPTKR